MLKGGRCQTQIKAISHPQIYKILLLYNQLNVSFTNTEEPIANTTSFIYYA